MNWAPAFAGVTIEGNSSKTNSMTDRKIYKPKPVSGFPEWLPEYRAVEQRWMDHIRKTFESYGYTNIETPAVEELEVLTAKGEVDKEIYVLERLQKDPNEKSDARLGLHFDQTVPMARYVAQHFSELTFPFKRYQMQKVWRGERPQLGRMREFYQCDIDVIGIDNLPLHFDAEMPAVIYECLMGLNIGRVQIRISNRKILFGLLEALGITDTVAVTRNVDKLEKIGPDAVRKILQDDCHLDSSAVDQILALAEIRATPRDPLAVQQIVCKNETMLLGQNELETVLASLSSLPPEAVIADLSIIRGLDYYTGTVYEAKLLDIADFTSTVVAGGRYDDLAGNYINKHLPGVGISIGVSRLFDVLKNTKKSDGTPWVAPGRKCPTDVLVAVHSEESRLLSLKTAHMLRQGNRDPGQGLNVEVFHKPALKPGKDNPDYKDTLVYAEKKGIPYVWFPPVNGKGHEVKDMTTREQIAADPLTWQLPKSE